eukprot:gnl/TRDRNA2_/TRDRNA2_29477_c0_seq2.p2 gnl/TRDRNA2_/TRDRNA2_29477_c0~~gnl/TRDRNA2_/TRDRNA2_29477_c0_seq2.p2  ORF type:complete len:146 (+),score=24.75 gnl/TRDRNA2_/TRDRNA2_29477_c0_seq2:89-526(+)
MEEPVSKALKTYIPLTLMSIGPLTLTSGKDQPVAVALGLFLSTLLAKMTFNLSGAPLEFDKAQEAEALKKMIGTSSANRVVRMLLGSVFLYSAFKFSKRSSEWFQGKSEKNDSLSTTGWQVTSWAACGWLCLWGSIWICTGFYGY